MILSGMTYQHFLALCNDTSLAAGSDALPAEPLLLALWHDHRGHWDVAHGIAQEIPTEDGSAVHAYLHREEGDLSNAMYWYRRAGRAMPDITLEEEWESLARECSS